MKTNKVIPEVEAAEAAKAMTEKMMATVKPLRLNGMMNMIVMKIFITYHHR